MQRLLPLFALLLLSAATAQGRLNPPTYYLSQLPELISGDTLSGELTEASGQNFKDGSYLDMFVMYGEEGDLVTLRAASYDFDTYLSLFDPSGWLISAVDDGPNGTDAELSITLPETGRYLVVLSGYSAYQLGSYTISRTDGAAAGEAEAIPLPVPGTLLGSMDGVSSTVLPYWGTPAVLFVLELEEDAAVEITARSADFDTFIVVTDENGAVLIENDDENYSEATDWNTDSKAFTMFAAGTYYVYLSSVYGDAYGDYTISTRRFVAVD